MPDIRHSIQIAAPVEPVFALIATAHGFKQWWAEDVTEAGASIELGFFRRATVYRLHIKAVEAPHHIQWLCETGKEWTGTSIGFELETAGAGTLLNFKHGGWSSETPFFISCNTTWGELMFRLKSAAEGRSPGPLFSADGMAY